MRSCSLTGLAGVTIVAALALAGCSGSDGDVAADPAPTAGTSCSYSEGESVASKKVDLPPTSATETGKVAVTISTNVGDIQAELDAGAAPCTVNSFVSLAEQGYFDDTGCHRLTTAGISVLQCGDPSGTGGGGPGYSFKDELSGSETYPVGTLAMANAGPDTNGSQFFIVYGDTPLPPKWTVFGQINEAGVAVVQKVADAGTDDSNGIGDGHPKTKVDITKVTVSG